MNHLIKMNIFLKRSIPFLNSDLKYCGKTYRVDYHARALRCLQGAKRFSFIIPGECAKLSSRLGNKSQIMIIPPLST